MTSGAGVLSTRLTTSTMLWSPSKRRWLTMHEKFTMMGFPTSQPLASAVGCPLLSTHQMGLAPCNFDTLIGNTAHAPTLATVCACALASIALAENLEVLPTDMDFCQKVR